MNLKKKESSKNIINNNNNNDIKKEGSVTYIIDSKNIQKKENIKNYNEELSKFFNKKIDSKEEDEVNESTNSSTTNTTNSNNKSTHSTNTSKILMRILIEKLFPKRQNKEFNSFNICKMISSGYFEKHSDMKKENNKIEECVNFIYEKKLKLSYTNTIEFNSEMIQNIGYILMMTYSKLGSYKINEAKSLKENVDRLSKDTQDPLTDFYIFAGSKKKSSGTQKNSILGKKFSKILFTCNIHFFNEFITKY